MVGGPYYSGNTIEIAANFQIARFVQLVAKPLPNIDILLDHSIATKQYESTELAHPYILFLLATMYNRPEIMQYIATHRLQTCLHRAIALAVLKNKAVAQQRELVAICNEQQSTGWWKNEPLAENWPGSQIATTALIVGILAAQQQKRANKSFSALLRQHQAVAQKTKQLFDSRTEPLRSLALATVNKVCQADKGFEITLLAYFFGQALKSSAHLTNKQYTLLGAASVCGWVAYTIYDDFLDEEGTPVQLPIANIAMRSSLDCFRSALSEDNNFQRYVAHIFTEMDEANAWEVHNCRFTVQTDTIIIIQLPKYGKCTVLATRSFAHALGPMAVLAHHTQSTAKKIRYIEAAFRHYLIARQLSDDIYDWPDDIQAGSASYVVTMILRDMRLQPGTYTLSILLTAMRKQFRHTTMIRTCELALNHVRAARRSFAKYELLQTSNSIYTFLDDLELSLHYSLDQHTKACALVKT